MTNWPRSLRRRRCPLDRRPDGDHLRDRGITLTETIMMVAVVGVIAASTAAAVGTVLRSERATSDRVGNARDTQQAVNWFPLDVQRAPTDRAAYLLTSDNSTPWCGTGTNIVSIRHDDGTAVSYTLEHTGNEQRLVRRLCPQGGAAEPPIRIASLLDTDVAEPVRVELDMVDGAVVQARLMIAQAPTRQSGSSENASVWGSPRLTGTDLDPASLGPQGPSTPLDGCDLENPLVAAQGFVVFVAGDARLTNSTISRAVGIGGWLGFDGSSIGSQGGNDSFRPASIGLYTRGVDWHGSTGQLLVPGPPAGGVVVVDASGIEVDRSRGDQILSVEGSSATILANSLRDLPPGQEFSMGAEFDRLRACSVRLAQLPDSCAGCAVHVTALEPGPAPGEGPTGGPTPGNEPDPDDPPDPSDPPEPGEAPDPSGPQQAPAQRDDGYQPYSGSGPVVLELTPGTTNVLNLHEDQLASLGSEPVWLGSGPAQADALVINVIGEGEMRIGPLPISHGADRVIWNLTGVERVHVQGPIRGTILAPGAEVHVSGHLDGNVVARTLIATAATIEHHSNFAGRIRWS